MHNSSNVDDGLKGKALFAVLEDLGISFHSKEERQWYVEVVAKFDRDASGTINFIELCQIIRKVINMEEEKTRRRQFDLIEQSGLPFQEVEDWNSLFNSKDEQAKGELMLSEVKALIVGLGVKWDKEVSDKIMAWITESDDNNNGSIDFGEFCLVISKMWAANLHDIRGAARDLLVKDRTVSLQSVHDTYIAATKDGILSARRHEAGDTETFVMKRNPNGNICLQSRWGKFVKVLDDDHTNLDCKSDRGTEFKLTTLEDERVVLSASTPTGGNLFVRGDGSVAVSDGNPADLPFTIFTVVSHEELHKKCWSKSSIVIKAKPTTIAEARKRSKDLRTPRETEDPVSPGLKKSIDDIDSRLETKALLSARGTA